MKFASFGIILSTLFRVHKLLPSEFRAQAIVSFVLLFVNSLLDILGLGAVIPLIIVLLKKEAYKNNELLFDIYNFFGLASEKQFIILICILILVVIVTKNIISVWIKYYQSSFAFSLQNHFSMMLFKAIYDKGFRYFKERNSSEIIRNINSNSTNFSQKIIIPLLNLLNELTTLLIIVLGLLIYEPYIVALLVLIIVPTFGLFYLLTKKRIQKYAEKQFEWTPFVMKNILEAVHGYIDVQITRTKLLFYQRHKNIQRKLKEYQVKLEVVNFIPSRIIEVGMMTGVISIIIYGLIVFDDRSDLITLLGVFAIASYRVLPSINRLIVNLVTLKGFQYAVVNIEDKLVVNKTIPDEEISTEQITFNNDICFKNISFSYNKKVEDSPVIRDFSMTVNKGDTVGVIGKSGSGKSTLFNLLLGFLVPQEGSVLVDGVTLTAKNKLSWLEKVAYVQQSVFLVDGSIKENVAFGQDVIDEQKVEEALKVAKLWEFVSALPDKMGTNVGEGGGLLSGGQRQRIGIARAIYRGAEILLFDEATSALDNETEQEVTESINHLKSQNLTMIIIAHRVTTLKYCDHIVELDNGRLSKNYTYNELINSTISLSD